MKIKTAMPYYLISTNMAVNKKTDNNKFGGKCGKIGTFIHHWW